MEWNVYAENHNLKKIEAMNVLNHQRFFEAIKWLKKLSEGNKEEFAINLKKEAMYYFHGKAEYEIVVSDWPGIRPECTKKVSVYDQIILNWEAFVDYCWENFM